MKRIETAINWFYERRGRVTYSMNSRYGPNSYDCSSAVYYALCSAGLLPTGTMGNTDSLFGHLEQNGWVQTSSPQRGCVFIWGTRGASGGSYGHTGIFVSNTEIIHCTSSGNGIVVGGHNPRGAPVTIYINNNLIPDETDEPPEDVEEEPERFYNIGELDSAGIKNGKVWVEGWHYSYGKKQTVIQFINAENDNVIATVTPDVIERDDLPESYPDQDEIEQSGFYAEHAVPDGTSVYFKGVIRDDEETDELIFPSIITFEKAYDIDVDEWAVHNRGLFYKIFRAGKHIHSDKRILEDFSWSNELMYVPTTEIRVPIELNQYITGREEIQLFINNKVFHGIVTEVEEDIPREILIVTLTHVISEWEYRQISTNLASKDRTINDLYSTLDFRYVGWNIEFLQDAATRKIDYVYSRQSKLDGLIKTCELTDDVWWRVGFDFGRKLQIGTFGEKTPYVISKNVSGVRNIQMIEEPVIVHDMENVINIATVYGEKSDSGMSSMSLREVYNESGAQKKGFPVLILKNGINNERNYDYVEFTKLAPNNEIEYTVLDEESIAIEQGNVIEGTFSFNDLAPFNVDDEEITDEDRARASKMAYDAAVKKLKMSRRRYIMEIKTAELHHDVNVGNKILVRYDNSIWMQEECGSYMKKILNIDDYFYITSIEYNFDVNGIETNVLRLEKFLHTTREIDYQ